MVGFINAFKAKCKAVYQPFQQVTVSECMLKSKHCSRIRQYIKNKPTKRGIKLWVTADSAKGYTYDFNVHIGRNIRSETSTHGFGNESVIKLAAPY